MYKMQQNILICNDDHINKYKNKACLLIQSLTKIASKLFVLYIGVIIRT